MRPGPICTLLFLVAAACGGGNSVAPPTRGDGSVATGGEGGTGCLTSCSQVSANCGPLSDGCGGIIQCGDCPLPTTCGGAGTANVCGQVCRARTCAAQGLGCGPAGDGCGGLLQCGNCTAPQTCGGGGTPSQCGGDSGCVPSDCTAQGIGCGPTGDGCGGLLQCGDCTAPDVCGGGGTHGQCGNTAAPLPDSGTICTPKTCADLGIACGPAGDGCGGLLQCGSCTAPQTCGGGAAPGTCGGSTGCVPTTCAHLGVGCGPAGDGCGGLLACGDCPAPQTCGGAGVAGQCGTACTPRTCAQLGYACGPAGDGCGGLIQCGNCFAPDICGGGGVPGQCGGGHPDGGAQCTNLCLQRVDCGGTAHTTITGTVYNPAGTDPLYNALVYIPNGTVQPFATGVSCDKCGTEVSGSPLISAYTGADGTFKLVDVPVGSSIPLVIQLGRWRRYVTIPSVPQCVNTALTSAQTRMPRWQHETNALDNIPLMAMVTGAVDALECVLRKMGVDDREFTTAGGTGRIQFYDAEDYDPYYGFGYGANAPGGNGTGLTSSATALARFDLVIFACEGEEFDKASSHQTNVINYANSGGRVFATHFSYTWLYNDSPFSGTAAWDINQSYPNSLTGTIDQSFAKGVAFAQWLSVVGALSAPGQVLINAPRHDLNSVVAPAQRWIYSTSPATIQHYTFNTPVGVAADQQCGRVLFSDFHVTDAVSQDVTFPYECSGTTLTAQEKILEFMLFDLANCITPDNPPPPPSCTTKTCAQLGFSCGLQSDGCSGQQDCGPCTPPDTCGGGGTPGVCGHRTCPSQSCAAQGIGCGPAGDGCGHQLDCGPCAPPATCGGAGTPGQCGHSACVPLTCLGLGFSCGPAGDGCGGLLQCGNCTPPDTCGGGGTPGVCGHTVSCNPASCQDLSIGCGPAGDGCGGLLDCGTCTPPLTCGGGGVPGQCGESPCMPRSCADQSIACGPAGDGCGGLLDCGACTPPQTCGGGGTPGQCGTQGPIG